MITDNSYLLITLDSCRYDAFVEASAPNMKSLGALHMAMAPGYFTYASHAAMLMGFTPGIAGTQAPFINPKFGKIFKLAGAAFPGKGTEHIAVSGRNIVHGLRELGYATFGTSGNEWFNPRVPSGKHLGLEFDRFFFASQPQALVEQSAWLLDTLGSCNQPSFAFANINETHVPYWYPGAAWSRDHNPCVPFSGGNDASECRRRQVACIEYVDRLLLPLLQAFEGANTVICSDHGDCWGEDGLWEHGIWHEKIFEVPLLMRLRP